MFRERAPSSVDIQPTVYSHVETVALLSKNWSQAEHYIDVKVDLAEGLVLTALNRHYDKLPYWIKIQVDYLIS